MRKRPIVMNRENDRQCGPEDSAKSETEGGTAAGLSAGAHGSIAAK